LQTANKFLHNSRRFSVDILAEENPTYDEVAKLMDDVADIITLLADDFDPMMAQKASEYCRLMTKMGLAISRRDQEALELHARELDRRPFL